MSDVKWKVQLALEESRVLVIGANILLGAQYQAVFQKTFSALPKLTQHLHIASLCLTLTSFALLMSPVPRHLLGEDAESTHGIHTFTTRVAAWSLPPFAGAMALVIMVATESAIGPALSITTGALTLVITAALWFGPMIFLTPAERAKEQSMGNSADPGASTYNLGDEGHQPSDLATKIQQAFVEVRMVLPGAQALFGFQFIGTLTEAFEKLPASAKYVHLMSLGCVALSIAMLMAPAAFHRTVERGAVTRRQQRVTSWFIVAAMAVLIPGMTGDLYVVVQRITGSSTAGWIAAVAAAILLCSLWFLPAILAGRRHQTAVASS
ncbi:MAG TPA: DUF6328 family protein [Sphingomonas sp.]|jgi:hypothetical protein